MFSRTSFYLAPRLISKCRSITRSYLKFLKLTKNLRFPRIGLNHEALEDLDWSIIGIIWFDGKQSMNISSVITLVGDSNQLIALIDISSNFFIKISTDKIDTSTR